MRRTDLIPDGIAEAHERYFAPTLPCNFDELHATTIKIPVRRRPRADADRT